MLCAFILIGSLDQCSGGYRYDRQMVNFLVEQGVSVDVISLPRWPYLFAPLLNFSLIQRFRNKGYDVVIEDELAHPSLWLFNRWFKRHCRGELVGLVHLLKYQGRSHGIQGAWVLSQEQKMLSSCDHIIATSEYTKGLVEELGMESDKISVVMPGHDLPVETSSTRIPHEGLRLLCVAAVIEPKGIVFLIEALSRLSDSRVTLDIVGALTVEPRYVKRVEKFIARLNLEKRVRLHGEQPWEDLPAWYQQADIFVLPTLSEGYGMVIPEAMAFGLPVIATAVGVIPQLVREGENGLLAPPGDSDTLVRAIEKLATNASLRGEMGKKSLARVEACPRWGTVAQQFYRIILAQAQRA